MPHIHFHILPRSDGVSLDLHGRGMVDAKVLEPVAATAEFGVRGDHDRTTVTQRAFQAYARPLVV